MSELLMGRKRSETLAATTRLFILVLPDVHILDLAGPVQVFYEASGLGASYSLHYCGVETDARSAQGLLLGDLEPLPEIAAGDWVLVPGTDSEKLDDCSQVPAEWLRRSYSAGARVASICSGAFALAHAGLLDGRRCTTHWKVAERLAADYPRARVMRNRLFVTDGRVATSAGVASGIDMALSMVEEDHGPAMAARVARELVIYIRRDGRRRQESVYLDYRTHLHPGIHRVQDYLLAHPETAPTIEELAAIAGMSPRNLTRVFRQATGVTLKAFEHQLKMEVAGNLLHDPRLTVEGVAARCGFKDPRQLRRLWKKRFGMTPSAWKAEQQRRLSA